MVLFITCSIKGKHVTQSYRDFSHAPADMKMMMFLDLLDTSLGKKLMLSTFALVHLNVTNRTSQNADKMSFLTQCTK